MRKHKIENICWREVYLHRPYELETVWEVLSHLLGADQQYIHSIEAVFKAHGEA